LNGALQKIVCFLACNSGKSEGNLFWKSAATQGHRMVLMKLAMSLGCYRFPEQISLDNRQLGNTPFVMVVGRIVCLALNRPFRSIAM